MTSATCFAPSASSLLLATLRDVNALTVDGMDGVVCNLPSHGRATQNSHRTYLQLERAAAICFAPAGPRALRLTFNSVIETWSTSTLCNAFAEDPSPSLLLDTSTATTVLQTRSHLHRNRKNMQRVRPGKPAIVTRTAADNCTSRRSHQR